MLGRLKILSEFLQKVIRIHPPKAVAVRGRST
jgi:hypothetical protein